MNLTTSCWLTALAAFCGASVAAGHEPVYERFEGSTGGTRCGRVEFVEDVVGWGGLGTPNGSAAYFDGQAQTYILLGRDQHVTTDDFTVEAFVKVAERNDYAAIAGVWDERQDGRSWAFVLTARGSLRFDVSPDGKFHPGNKLETPGRLIVPGQWYHVAAVSRAGRSQILVNGRLVAERVRAVPGLNDPAAANLKIGNLDCYATVGPRPWHGWIDELRISPDALEANELLQTVEPMPEAAGPVPPQYVMPFTATSKAEALAWQKQARRRLLELVERQEPRRGTDELPLDLRLGAPQRMDGYTLYGGTFQGNDPLSRYPCRLAIPDGEGPFPAMVALHGHGGTCEAVFDPDTVYHGLADRLACGGYVVIAPSFPHRQYCATMLWDLMRLVDILHARPDVDRQRIGAAGLSMGGEWTMWLAACDQRVGAAVVSGWMCTTEGVFSVPNCECWELPGLVELMDVCEIHLLIAPRFLLFESAQYDNCFPIEFVRQGFARMQSGYRLLGAEAHVQQDVWPAGHEWHGQEVYPFLDQALGGHAAQSRSDVPITAQGWSQGELCESWRNPGLQGPSLHFTFSFCAH